MTTDVSLGGAFVSGAVQPPAHSRVVLVHEPADGGPTVALHGVVQRLSSAGTSSGTGFAVAWVGAAAGCAPDRLKSALRLLLGEDVEVKAVPDRGSAWASNPPPPGAAAMPRPAAPRPDPVAAPPTASIAPRPIRSVGADRRVALPNAVSVSLELPRATLDARVDEVGLHELWIAPAGDLPALKANVAIHFQSAGPSAPVTATVSGTVTHRVEGEGGGVLVRVSRIENHPPAMTYERWVAALALKHGRAAAATPTSATIGPPPVNKSSYSWQKPKPNA